MDKKCPNMLGGDLSIKINLSLVKKYDEEFLKVFLRVNQRVGPLHDANKYRHLYK